MAKPFVDIIYGSVNEYNNVLTPSVPEAVSEMRWFFNQLFDNSLIDGFSLQRGNAPNDRHLYVRFRTLDDNEFYSIDIYCLAGRRYVKLTKDADATAQGNLNDAYDRAMQGI